MLTENCLQERRTAPGKKKNNKNNKTSMNRYASDYAQYQPSSSTNSASGFRSSDNSSYGVGIPSRQSYPTISQGRSSSSSSAMYPPSSEPSVLIPPAATTLVSSSSSVVSSSVISTTTAPVYQIDFSATEIGKRIPSSKRRISWYVILLKLYILDTFIAVLLYKR